MATIVELFCSADDAEESQGFLLSGTTESARNSPQCSNAGRGRKLTRVRGGRTNRIGRNIRAKGASNTKSQVMSAANNDVDQSSIGLPLDGEEDEQFDNDNHPLEVKVSQTRRSCRTKTPSKHFNNEPQEMPRKRFGTMTHAPKRPKQPDVNQDGTPFCCDDCGSNYIVKPSRCLTSKGNAAVPKRKRVFGIRYKTDPKTKKQLTLCNACGMKFDRSEKSQDRYKVSQVTEQDKLKYQEDAKRFASSLVEGLKDPDAYRLACLHISSKPCGCMQRYIIAEGNMEESRDRAGKLLTMIKDAKKLKDKKSYNVEELINKGKKFRKVGLGNGQKRSKEFEEFVLTNRQYLRNSLKFCERACQRILSYSNNFLHKKLKTEPDRRERIERTKGKMALGLLKEISNLPKVKCCEAECVMMAHSHAVLLKTWRERANSGQAEARKVLAEMLTPSGKVSNCANFITLVTGCSLRTIQSVADQMRETGGDREPPTHGLKKYWKNNPRRLRSLSEWEQDLMQSSRETQQAAQKSGTDGVTSGAGGDNGSSAEIETPALTAAQLRDQQNQLKRLQQQLDEQQRHISHQQSVIEQQLQQHKLAMQQKRLQQKQRQHQQEQQQQQQQQQQQRQQLQQEQQQQQHLTETQQREMIQVEQQAPSEEVGTQPAARQQVDAQQASTQQQQMSQLAAQQQLLLQQLGAQQIAQQLAAQQQQVASTGTTAAVAQSPAGLEGMMDSRLLQQNMQQLLQEIQNQINVQQNSMHQLLLEMQSEMTAQQLQQLGIPNPNSSGVSSGTTAQTVTATPTATATASQPPPSYNAAVTLLNALNSTHMLNSNSVLNTSTQLLPQQQQQQQAGAVVRQGAAQPAQVIIQAIPAIQQNFLLGGATLQGQLLQGAGDSRQTAQQQILVSLSPSLTTECMTNSALTSTSLNQDSLNPEMVEIVELQQIPLANDASQSQANGIQQVNLTNELDAAALARLSRALSAQELRPGMGATLPQLQSRTAQTTSTPSELAATLARDSTVQSVLQGENSTDGQASSSTSLANEASQLNMNIESLLPAFQISGPAGQSLAVYKQSNANKPKH